MTFLKGLEKKYYIVDREYQIIHYSKEAKKTYPAMEVGAYCYECVNGRDVPCHNCPMKANNGAPVSRFDIQTGKRMMTYAFAVPGEHGQEQFVIVSGEQKEEEKSRFSDEKCVDYEGCCDMLTGLPGREGLFRRLGTLVPQPNTTYCMLAIDIEHFHFINKWFGRETGDRMLAAIGRFLKETDSIFGCFSGYFGGDNFCVSMAYNEEAVAHIRRGVIDIVSKFEEVSGFRPMFGGYCYSDPTISFDECYDCCLTATSRVVDNAESDIVWFDEAMVRELEAEIELMPKIKQALKNKEFVVYLQPKCQMQTGKIVGAEALVRWNHPTEGIISPGKFIPTLEKNGYIAKLDRYVWESVFAMIRRWQQEGRRFVPVSVNVSRVDIFSMDVAQFFVDLLQKYQIPVSSIEIEITESAYADNEEIIHEVEQKLREAGFRILLDDFGSGYSALNMLKDIDIDIIKLDMKFFQMDDGNVDRGINIINGIMSMARQLDLPVIAEGIETDQQCEILDMVGCSYAQGYYFYKPMPISAFERLTEDESKLASIGSVGYVNRKQDKSYLQEILEYFWKVAEVNLKSGEYRFIRAIQEADYIYERRANTIEEYITRYISHGRIHPDDIKRYRKASDRENILKDIQRGKNRNRCAVRYKQADNSYQWIIFEAMKLPDYSEDNPNALFIWKEADSAAATNEDALEIIRQTFRTIVKINLKSGRFELIQDLGGEMLHEGAEVVDLIAWTHGIIAGGHVHTDDAQRLAAFIDPETIYRKLIKNPSTLRLRYRQKRNGVFTWVLLEVAPSIEFTPENPVVRLYVRDLMKAYGDNELDPASETGQEHLPIFEERNAYDLVVNLTKDKLVRNKDIIAWETDTGIPRKPFSEQIQILADEFVTPEYRADFLQFLNRARIIDAFMNNDTTANFEYQRLLNGKQTWIRVSLISYRNNESGDVMGSFHIENVDPMKRLELMTREKMNSEYQKRPAFTIEELLQGIPGGFVIYRADPTDEKILFVNDEALRLYGCSTMEEFRELTGGYFSGMVHPEDYQSISKQIAEQMDGSRQSELPSLDAVIYRIVCKDGSVRKIQDYGRLMKHELYGEVYCVFISEIVDEQLLEVQFKYHVQSHLYDAYQKPEGFV
ncbi:MAG: EAL domain-containing protein, partial [bacterium]|nr:EAL domain-containing protein [bacterium]